MSELHSLDGVGSELDRAYALGDRYQSPAYGWPSGEQLRKRSRHLANVHRRANHVLMVDLTEGDALLALELTGDATHAGVVAAGDPYHGPVLVHAADPGLEYAIRFVPDERGEGWADTTRVVALHVLGLRSAFQISKPSIDSAEQAIRDSLAEDFADGRLGNTHCDWRNHPSSYEARLHVMQMSVLIISRGAILQAWVCCPKCRVKLDRDYPGGLCWLP